MREDIIQADTVSAEVATESAAKMRMIVMMVTSFLYVNNQLLISWRHLGYVYFYDCAANHLWPKCSFFAALCH